MKENILLDKSYRFALRIVRLYFYLVKNKKEFVLSKQLLKSGTSIGANAEEANGGVSKREFYVKITIAYKEARETHYWIRLLRDSNILEAVFAVSILNDCEELCRILASIQKSSKEIP